MENTLENKAKFLTQYYGQELGFDVTQKNIRKVDAFFLAHCVINYLQLTPLHLISDEDARKLPNRQYDGFTRMYENKEEFLTSLEIMRFLTQEEVDILRSLGYAVNFQDLSVEQQVEYGWVRLKTEI